MMVKIQGTGCLPIEFDAARMFTASETLEGDKRTVIVNFYEIQNSYWYARIVYKTEWPTERDFTRVIGALPLPDLIKATQTQMSAMLPPGAGYPATPQFADRQLKLVGTLYTHAMTALSAVLNDIHQDTK